MIEPPDHDAGRMWMDWFRKHIRLGSQLALFALALQFVLAFGHNHQAHAQTITPAPLSYIELVAAAIDAEYGGATATLTAADDHAPRQHHPLTDTCAICAVVAISATALFSSSPILHLPEAVALLYRVTDAGFAHLDPTHGPFQPRAPPAS